MKTIDRLRFDLQALGYVTEVLADVGSATKRGVILNTKHEETGATMILSVVMVDEADAQHPGVPASLYLA
jgi:hypothetical protein